MKKYFYIIFLISSLNIFAQDIDFYNKGKNDNFLLPNVPKEMSFDEYQIMSRTFRMQDMMYSFFVPGYVHFKALDKNTGYAILTVRTAAFATLGYETLWAKNTAADTSLWYNLQNLNNLTTQTKYNTLIATTALFTIGASYLFDIIHGKYRLEKKQDAIRYKYSIKASLSSSYTNNNATKSLGFNLGFYLYF